MRTYVATYKIYVPFTLEREFDKPLDKQMKYKFEKSNTDDYTICYVTLLAQNRLQMRFLKKKNNKYLKGLGKVELIVGVG